MILRRYGTTVQSVELNFDSKALNEIGFRRDRKLGIPADEFERTYTLGPTHDLTAEADGPVQGEAEAAMLDDLEGSVRDLEAGLGEHEVLVVENEQGKDYPKTKHRTQNVVVDGENRLYFHHWIEPPLRLGVYRKSQ